MAPGWSFGLVVVLVVVVWNADAQDYGSKTPHKPPTPTQRPMQPAPQNPQRPNQNPQTPIQRPMEPALQQPQTPIQRPMEPALQEPQTPIQRPMEPALQEPQTPIQRPMEPALQQPQTPIQRPMEPALQQPQTPIQRPMEPALQQPQTPIQRPMEPALQQPQTPIQRPMEPALQEPQTPIQRPMQPMPDKRLLDVSGSPFPHCQVEAGERVQCGAPDISPADCEAINCCSDGQQCYYGKAVTVQCTKDGQFVLVVARDATLPQLDLEAISLLGGGHDAPCSPVEATAAFAIFQFPVTACNTTMKEESGSVVYQNHMVSSYEVGLGPKGSITRDSHFELQFQCRYSGTSVEALVIEVNDVPPPLPVAAPGAFRVEIRLANGQCVTKGCVEEQEAYSSFYTQADYPVTKVLQDPVYVEVRILERSDPNIVLTLDHCWATSNSNPLSLPQWNLLIDGCPYHDDRYLTTMVPVDGSSGLQYPTHHKRFIFRMFTFVDNESMLPLKESVFIHCSTAVCHPSAAVSCVQRCNRKRRSLDSTMYIYKDLKNVVSCEEIDYSN